MSETAAAPVRSTDPVPSIDDIASVNHHGVSLNKGRLGRAEKQCAISDFLNCAHPSHRRNVDRRFEKRNPLFTARCHWRGDDPRTDAVDADAVLRVVNRIAACHANDCRLGCTVRRWTQLAHSGQAHHQAVHHSRAFGRPTIPSCEAMLTIDPRSPGRPSWLGSGSC